MRPVNSIFCGSIAIPIMHSALEMNLNNEKVAKIKFRGSTLAMTGLWVVQIGVYKFERK